MYMYMYCTYVATLGMGAAAQLIVRARALAQAGRLYGARASLVTKNCAREVQSDICAVRRAADRAIKRN